MTRDRTPHLVSLQPDQYITGYSEKGDNTPPVERLWDEWAAATDSVTRIRLLRRIRELKTLCWYKARKSK